jgi:hypothetical protein
MRVALSLLFICMSLMSIQAQEGDGLKRKRMAARDSIQIDSISISPRFFSLRTKKGQLIDSTMYRIDFSKSLLTFKENYRFTTDSVDVTFQRLPDFITRIYQPSDPSVILANNSRQEKLVALKKARPPAPFTPFEGLQTSGSISRGFRSGNKPPPQLSKTLESAKQERAFC